MPSKKKKFIDKKNAVTFHLVHRSQRDPLVNDENAPQHVLFQPDEASQDSSSRREDQIKYGIYYDDDYNYLQHLRDVNEINEVGIVDSYRVGKVASQALVQAPRSAAALLEDEIPQAARSSNKITLPSTVFGSTVETDVGLLNKAVPLVGPQPDLDPDIVAAMDEDFDYDDPDNLLDDDFMMMANADREMRIQDDDDDEDDDNDDDDADDDDDHDVDSNAADNSEDDDDVGSLGEMSFSGEETRSRFTSYSMTSSVMRRNEGLTLLDERFEKFYEQYDEDEIGALDGEEILGTEAQDSVLLQKVLDDFERETKVVVMKDFVKKAVKFEESREESESEGELEKMSVEVPTHQYDCESILSTRSTLYNHPTKIPIPEKKPKHIQLTKRAEIPADVLPTRGPTRKQEEAGEERVVRGEVPQRVKGESAEDKRARKQAVKEERRVRREEKSANKKAFKDERKRLDKEVLNVKQNLQSVKIV